MVRKKRQIKGQYNLPSITVTGRATFMVPHNNLNATLDRNWYLVASLMCSLYALCLKPPTSPMTHFVICLYIQVVESDADEELLFKIP